MKRTAYLFLIIISVVLLFGGSAYAGWKDKVALNQVKAAQYILALKKGANPNTLERPHLRREDKYKAKVANREVREAMDQAEELARTGKHKLIKDPQFKAIISDEGYQRAEEKYKKQ